jgi:hypothetical protein
VKAIIIETLGTRVESGTDAPIENLASLVFDDEKAMQHSECHRQHGQEIEGSGYLAVILEGRGTSGWDPRAEPHDADIGPRFVPPLGGAGNPPAPSKQCSSSIGAIRGCGQQQSETACLRRSELRN